MRPEKLTRIYLGNLSFNVTAPEIEGFFATSGVAGSPVTNINIVVDRETGRPRGFGFAEVADRTVALEFIRVLDGQQLGGRTIKVSEAVDRPQVGYDTSRSAAPPARERVALAPDRGHRGRGATRGRRLDYDE